MSCWEENTLDGFIQGWLESIQNSAYHPKPAVNCATQPRDSHQELNPGLISSPLSASKPPECRSPKRQHGGTETNGLSPEELSCLSPGDIFSKTDKHLDTSSCIFDRSAVNLSPPSVPSTIWSAQGPSRSSRSRSPIRCSTLELLDKPVYYVPIKDDPSEQLSEAVLPMYDRIVDITLHRERFLPRAVEKEIMAAYRRNWILPHMFFDDEGDDDLSAQHAKELIMLSEMVQAAEKCQTEEASEEAWHLKVHGPLLKLGFDPFPSLSRHILAQARISKQFAPEMRGHYPLDFTRPSTHLYEMTDRSVNQTTYRAVRFSPIAISIATGFVTGAFEEARSQLGVWTAAWHKRISVLLDQTSSSAPSRRIVTLPLILTLEHQWRLLFACDRGDRIVSAMCRLSNLANGVNVGNRRRCDYWRHKRVVWAVFCACDAAGACFLDSGCVLGLD